MSREIVALTAAALDQIPDDQLGGSGDPVADGLDTLTDGELVTVAAAVKQTADASPAGPIKAKAVRVLKAAERVAYHREKIRPVLAKKRAYPAVFAASPAGQKLTAVAAHRVRLGKPATGTGTKPGNGGGNRRPIRRPVGSLRNYRMWVNQGRWGRGWGSGTLEGLAGLSGAYSPGDGQNERWGPEDAIEAAIIGSPNPLQAFGLGGLSGLAGLNLGKFFKNLAKGVGGVASVVAPLAAFVPGVGTVVGSIANTAANLASGFASPQQAPTYGPPVYQPPPPPPQPSTPPWLIPAAIAGGVLLLTRK
jgi:hypothetical protein